MPLPLLLLPYTNFTLHVSEVLAFSEGAIRNNAMVVEYCRNSMAALGGGTAGILGLTSLYGFAFYLFCGVAVWVSLRIY